MPSKAKIQPASSSAKAKRLKAKAKFWVLWEPPARILVVTVAAGIFASAGLVALRASSAQPTTQQTASGLLLWQDEPASPVGSIISASASSQVMQHWRPSTRYIYGGGTVRVVQDGTKNKALEFFGAANMSQPDAFGDNQRAEQIADVSLKKGGTYWFGFDLWVAPGGGVSSGRQSVWEILSQPDKTPSKLWVGLNSNQDGLAIETNSTSSPVGSIPDKAWSRLVIGAYITDDNDAWMEVWRDGQLVAARQSVPGGLVSDSANAAMMAAGLYRSAQPWDLKVRMANLKIANNRDAVL